MLTFSVTHADYGELCAQQPGTKTSRDDVNKANWGCNCKPGRRYSSHAGGTPGTRYRSLEMNYHTAPDNERTTWPILQKIISAPLCLLGRAECGWWLGGPSQFWVVRQSIICWVVLPIDIENPYRLSNCLYRYISIYIGFLATNF